MSAIASGWLSFTPRSSRRRATIAAIEIRSLSFSRGVRFIVGSPQQVQTRGSAGAKPRPSARSTFRSRVSALRIAAPPPSARATSTPFTTLAPPASGAASNAPRAASRAASRRSPTKTSVQSASCPAKPLAASSAAPARPDETQRVRPDEPPAAEEAPVVAQVERAHDLAHRAPPEDERLGGEEARTFRRAQLGAALEHRAVEEQRLLGRPVEGRGFADLEPRADRRRPVERAVDLLGGLADQRRARTRLEARVDLEAVAAADAARGVEQHRDGLGPFGPREDHAHRAALPEPRERGAAVVAGRELDPRRAVCARERSVAARLGGLVHAHSREKGPGRVRRQAPVLRTLD